MNLTRNFTRKELQCQGCKNSYCAYPEQPLCNIDKLSLEKLQKLRDMVAVPLIVTSACRCHPHNKAVGGKDHSYHRANHLLPSRAFDIKLPIVNGKRLTPEAFMGYGRKVEFTSFGLYNSFVHMDDREFPAFWDLRK